MTKEFKDIPLEFINKDNIVALEEQKFLKNVFTFILNNRSEETMCDVNEQLSNLTFNFLMENWTTICKFTNVEELNVFLRDNFAQHFISVIEEENDLFVLAVVIILKTIGVNYIPLEHHVILHNYFRIQTAVINDRSDDVKVFLTSLWSNLLFIRALGDFEIYSDQKQFNSMWTVVTFQNNELETISVTIPESVTDFTKNIVYDEKTDNLIVEIKEFKKQINKVSKVNDDSNSTEELKSDTLLTN